MRFGRNTGELPENILETMFRRLEAAGLAWARPSAPSTGIDASGRRFFKRAAGPDFQGVLQGGRALVFDVKSTRQRAWTWPEGAGRRAGTRARQVADLSMAGRLGALAGIVIFFLAEAPFEVTWVPWQGLPRLLRGTFTPEKILGGAAGPHVSWRWPGMSDEAFLTGIREVDRVLAYRYIREVCDPVEATS